MCGRFAATSTGKQEEMMNKLDMDRGREKCSRAWETKGMAGIVFIMIGAVDWKERKKNLKKE